MTHRKRKVIGKKITVEPQSIPVVAPQIYLQDGEINPEAIRFFRNQHGLSQAKFAELIGCSLSTAALWEQGRITPGHTYRDRVHQFCIMTIRLLNKFDGWLPPSVMLNRHFYGPEEVAWNELLEIMMDPDVHGELHKS